MVCDWHRLIDCGWALGRRTKSKKKAGARSAREMMEEKTKTRECSLFQIEF
jgi:hypothetical protein